MTKIVHLQYSARATGDFAIRLQREFLKRGIDSEVLALVSDVPEEDRVSGLGRKSRWTALLDHEIQMRLTRNTDPAFGGFSFPVLGTDVSGHKQIREADVIYIHWALGGFLNLQAIRNLTLLDKPLVFVLHDMWAMTGGCHHSFTCDKYRQSCAQCPIFLNRRPFDLARMEYRRKAKLYSGFDRFYFIAPSRWMLEQAAQSALLRGKPTVRIPNVLDRNLFCPLDKRVCRQLLQIDPEDTVLTFGANMVESPFKGWDYLKKSLAVFHRNHPEKNPLLLVFGAIRNKNTGDIPFRTRFLGQLRDDRLLPVVYGASDLFIAPSLAETLSYTVFEALCCGTPVAAFRTGGIPDLVRHKENGYLAACKDPEDLARGIAFCLENACIGKAPYDFDTETSMQKHLDLIRQIT